VSLAPDSLDVLFVGVLPPHPGGSAISAGEIVAGLARRGHRIRALAPITPEAARRGDDFAERHPDIAMTRYHLPFFHTDPGTPTHPEYRRLEQNHIEREATALLSQRRPDLIFVGRETHAPPLAGAAASRGVPFVMRLPGTVTGTILTGEYPWTLAGPVLHAYRAAAAMISPGHHLAHRMRGRLDRRVVVIPTAIDLDRFAPREKDGRLLRDLQIPEDAVVVTHASNLKPVKRPLDLVRSAIEATRHDPRLMYLIVGDGLLRHAMEDACRRSGIHHRFRFAGWVEYREMPTYLSLADLVVMPSEFEGLARAYVEAQACGRALVASDIPAAREVIVDGETGLLFPVGDVGALTATTLRLAAAPEMRAAIGRQARARAGPHALGGAVDAYERVLQEVARRAGAAV
jgi:glycosyltransferase involved in cell wall biosynthesis